MLRDGSGSCVSLLKFVVVGRFGRDARTEKPVVEGQRRAWEQPRPDTAGEQTDVTRDLPRVLADAVCTLAAATEAAAVDRDTVGPHPRDADDEGHHDRRAQPAGDAGEEAEHQQQADHDLEHRQGVPDGTGQVEGRRLTRQLCAAASRLIRGPSPMLQAAQWWWLLRG